MGRNEKPPKVSLFIADVDGSLVTEDKVLTRRAQAAVKALDAAGISFAITSGRPPRGMTMLVEPLALRTPVAGFNGGIFIRPDMTIIEEHRLAPDAAMPALKLILDHGMDRGSIAATTGICATPRRRTWRASNRRSSLRRPSSRIWKRFSTVR